MLSFERCAYFPKTNFMNNSLELETKNQWARDDPAFVAILIFFMSMASLAFAIAFRVNGFMNILKIVFWAVFVDFISIGVLIATIGWYDFFFHVSFLTL